MADASNLGACRASGGPDRTRDTLPGSTAASRLFVYVSRHGVLAWSLLAVRFLLFGLSSLNLLHGLRVNLNFLAEHGVDAVRDGGLPQLAEIVPMAYLAVA